MPATSKFSNYIEQVNSSVGKNSDGVVNQIKNLPNNDYLMSLVQGKYYNKEESDGFVNAGVSAQSIVLATAVLSQMNANNKINQNILKSVEDQVSTNWINGLKSSTRDQLLRSISLQLSVNNLINYQRLQEENLNSLLKLSGLLDNYSIKNEFIKERKKLYGIESTLNNINYKLNKFSSKTS
ncbi:hypothetical protein [Piscirickettsia litoralis]|uniref:Uncharacterized protein n=1 Tax=Piscirickettsia litoralis TaxID=1891921 RepID=A0ABX2ZXX1_9GAMM|nr:hypothetical protein [Piscirickettsia litoralis]ODN41464.1 hypothetical protein BGC07_15185 [Piscirickettsia litoralis]